MFCNVFCRPQKGFLWKVSIKWRSWKKYYPKSKIIFLGKKETKQRILLLYCRKICNLENLGYLTLDELREGPGCSYHTKKGGKNRCALKITRLLKECVTVPPVPVGCCILFLFFFRWYASPGFALVTERALLPFAKLFTRRVALPAFFMVIKCAALNAESQWPSGGTHTHTCID